MSFADELAAKTFTVRDARTGEWDNEVHTLLDQIKELCMQRAEQGENTLQCKKLRVQHSDHAWFMQKNSQGLTKFEYTLKQLEQVLKDMGLQANVQAELSKNNYWLHANISVSWGASQSSKQAAKKQSSNVGNHTIQCGVCLEQKPAARLSPCGHLICVGCSRQQDLNECPFCRKRISQVEQVFEP